MRSSCHTRRPSTCEARPSCSYEEALQYSVYLETVVRASLTRSRDTPCKPLRMAECFAIVASFELGPRRSPPGLKGAKFALELKITSGLRFISSYFTISSKAYQWTSINIEPLNHHLCFGPRQFHQCPTLHLVPCCILDDAFANL